MRAGSVRLEMQRTQSEAHPRKVSGDGEEGRDMGVVERLAPESWL